MVIVTFDFWGSLVIIRIRGRVRTFSKSLR